MHWLRRVDAVSRLANPRLAVEWNLHKRYLVALGHQGIRVVPTKLQQRHRPLTDWSDWQSDCVIKPAVSAASFGTRRFTGEPEVAVAYAEQLLQHGDVLVQPFVPSVITPGERALVWIDGQLTHHIVKQPRFADDDEAVSAALPIARFDRELTLAALNALPFPTEELLYARIDVVDDHDGQPMIAELELIEPSLFLAQHPPALQRLVDAIKGRLSGSVQ